jgi:queuosine precursor transporter
MRTRWLPVITGIFVGVLIISNIASVKPVMLWKFMFDGGTLLFPLSYIFGDVLTEVYGYRASRVVIWTGFFCTGMMAIVLWLVGLLPGVTADWDRSAQESYQRVLAPVGRIVIASLVAFFAGEFSNSFVLAKLKIITSGRFLWMRTISSTLVGEGLDTLIFCFVAFYGVWTNQTLIAVIVSNYIFKCLFEIVATPVTYAVVIGLKNAEKMDVYDIGTNFNPFLVNDKGEPVIRDVRGVSGSGSVV